VQTSRLDPISNSSFVTKIPHKETSMKQRLCINLIAFSLPLILKINPCNSSDEEIIFASKGSNICPPSYKKVTSSKWACMAAMALGDQNLPGDQDGETFEGSENVSDFPYGCYECPQGSNTCGKGTWFNTESSGQGNLKARPYCVRSSLDLEQPESGIIFVGDSDVDYWRESSSVTFPGSFNYGIAGYTCQQVQKDLRDLLKVVKGVKFIVLVCGENDLTNSSPSVTFKRFRKVYQKARRKNIRVLMMGTKPEPDTGNLHRKYRNYDNRLKVLAQKEAEKNLKDGPPFIFVDVYKAFKSLNNPRSLYAEDGLHLSAEGYAYWNTWVQNAHDNALCDDNDDYYYKDTCNCYLWKKMTCTKKN